MIHADVRIVGEERSREQKKILNEITVDRHAIKKVNNHDENKVRQSSNASDVLVTLNIELYDR